MATWRHLQVTHQGSYYEQSGMIFIFPANRIDTEWLFQKFPKISKHKMSNENYLVIWTDKTVLSLVFESLLTYLEDQGWECFSADGAMHFKRLEDNN